MSNNEKNITLLDKNRSILKREKYGLNKRQDNLKVLFYLIRKILN